jgi:hypothetical protein
MLASCSAGAAGVAASWSPSSAAEETKRRQDWAKRLGRDSVSGEEAKRGARSGEEGGRKKMKGGRGGKSPGEASTERFRELVVCCCRGLLHPATGRGHTPRPSLLHNKNEIKLKQVQIVFRRCKK